MYIYSKVTTPCEWITVFLACLLKKVIVKNITQKCEWPLVSSASCPFSACGRKYAWGILGLHGEVRVQSHYDQAWFNKLKIKTRACKAIFIYVQVANGFFKKTFKIRFPFQRTDFSKGELQVLFYLRSFIKPTALGLSIFSIWAPRIPRMKVTVATEYIIFFYIKKS